MNIKRVRNILKSKQDLSLQELAAASGEDKQHLQFILDTWEKRGRVLAMREDGFCSSPCKSCAVKSSCGPSDKRYRWIMNRE